MSNDKTLAGRIPFEEIETFESWSLPSLGEGSRVVPSVKKDPNKHKRDEPVEETVEELSDHQPAPLTAQRLQEITETAEKEAREFGFAQGYEEGMKQGEKKGTELGEQKAYRETREKLEQKTATFAELAEALFQPVTNHQAELENTLITMAVELAKHFIHTELSVNPALIFPTVEQAVSSLPAGQKNIQVFVSPEDLPQVQEEFAERMPDWRFIADSKMTRGGCRVESSASSVDFSFEKRLMDWRNANQGAELGPDEPTAPITDFRPSAAALSGDEAASAQAPQTPEPQTVDALADEREGGQGHSGRVDETDLDAYRNANAAPIDSQPAVSHDGQGPEISEDPETSPAFETSPDLDAGFSAADPPASPRPAGVGDEPGGEARSPDQSDPHDL